MKGRLLSILVLILLFMVPMVSGSTVTDDLDDGMNYMVYYVEHQTIPAPLIMDIVSVTAESSGESKIDIRLQFNEPIPQDAPYSLQIAFDSDQDAITGVNTPEWYYNGLGIDHMVEIEFNGVESIGAISEYSDGVWTEKGSPMLATGTDTITVTVDESWLGDSTSYSIMTYIIEGISLDMVPEEGEPPLEYDTDPIPEITDYDTPTVYIFTFSYPEPIEEGTPFQLDVLNFEEDAALVPYTYEWDLDGDGVYDVTQETASYTHMYPQNGEYTVTLRITDLSGISGENTQTITVLNTPPYDPQITAESTIDQGETLTVTGSASDLGTDILTYTWDIDGETYTGESVSVSFDIPGSKTITLTVTDQDGGTVQVNDIINVNETEAEQEPEPPIDPLLIVLVFLFGVGGFYFYNQIKPKPEEQKKPEKEEEKPPEEKDFCEEHPEIVEQEENACWDAQMDLDSAVGDVQDQYDDALPRWQSNAANVTKLITEWDATVQLIKYWTGVEDDIEKDADTVQEVAGVVTNAAGKAKTVFKEGGEAALRELGEDMAKDVGKSILGDISSTIGQVLELEGWAIKEIGLGFAKGVTGVDPEANAIKLRQSSEITFAGLCSWVSHSEAWNSGRRPPDTLDSLLEDIQGMQNALDEAKQAFEDAVKDFKCVMCDIPEHISEEIDALAKNLEKWEKTFEKLKEEVEKRLEEAKELYKEKDLYESQFEYLDKAQDNINRANRALG